LPDRPQLILASASVVRRQLLAGAGVEFDVEPADIDERAAELRLRSASVAARAKSLAEAKAVQVSMRRSRSKVIGADQILELEGVVFSKAANSEEACQILRKLRGRTHRLHSGVALAEDGEVVWSLVQSASLTVRAFSEAWLEAYLAKAGSALTQSVGAYQLEGLGAQLFTHIEGDYFTVLGLPLLPLLDELRRQALIED